MNILINCSNLKAGGGIQVADSILRNLYIYTYHQFTVVLSGKLKYLEDILKSYKNIKIYHYTSGKSLLKFLTGRDKYLDKLVTTNKIDVVFFVFGPSLWYPKVKTISGFAMGHLVLTDSPFWESISKRELLKIKFRNYFQKASFRRLSNCYYTENEFITKRLQNLFPQKKIVTISNTCHQIFDSPQLWDKSIILPPYEGITLLTVSANYPHKNLKIIPKVLDELKEISPQLNVRFVLTVTADSLGVIDEEYLKNIIFLGNVNINQCPWLYFQSDALILPTMLECFSANYAEAMKMSKPILTSDLGFAHSLCGNAALYFNPTDPKSIATKIIELMSNRKLQETLIANGRILLKDLETTTTRVSKIISLIEDQ